MKTKSMKLKLLSAALLSLGVGSEAMASHFRGGYITWERVSGNTVKFTVQQAWRADFVESSNLTFGDGASISVLGSEIATGTDLAGNQYKLFKQEINHTYPNSNTFTAQFSNCCRIGNVINAPDGSFALQATINGSQLGGSVTSIPFILQVPRAVNLIDIPVIDPDGTASCRLATNGESGIPAYPSGFSITPDCKLSWNSLSFPHGTKVAAQLIMEQGGLRTPYDFIVEVNGNTVNRAPSCQLNGPANSTAGLNTPFSISATATDPEGAPLTLSTLGLPAGATLTPPAGSTGASPLTATFNWTPTSTGQKAVTLLFTDPNNQNCQASFTIDVNDAPPVANAGGDVSINEGVSVSLDGSGSVDPDGKPLTYAWVQTGGPSVTLTGANTATPTFTSPYVSGNQVLSFQLTVNDGTASATDSVDITVVNSNHPPIADAGDNGSIKEGKTAHLSAANSYDPDNEPVQTYAWSQVGGPTVTLLGANTASPSFDATLGLAGQTVTFRLAVSDGKESNTNQATLPDSNTSGDDLVSFTIVANSPPVADAGTDQTKDENTAVSLDGSASTDPDGDGITYEWTQIGGTPAVTLANANTATPSFTAPWVGTGGEALTFALKVTDNDPVNPKSHTDQVVVNVVNANDPPSCDLAQPSVATLWPPNHTLLPVSINGVADPNANFALAISGVTQDEPTNGLGDGDTSPDAVIQDSTPADTLLLRAERSGKGDGRVYQVNFTATDAEGSCSGSVKVTAPHDRKKTAVDSGQSFDSTQQ